MIDLLMTVNPVDTRVGDAWRLLSGTAITICVFGTLHELDARAPWPRYFDSSCAAS